ncbi:MAG: UDP-glucose 4-epimerase GalE [Gammaproteobacteria bacterium]
MNLENNTFLIVGGAGYIGSHMTLMLHELGHQVIVLDNLSTGYEDAVIGGKFILGDIHDSAKLDEVFKEYNIDVVMHFAAHIDVGESVRDPFKYYRNNVVGTQSLLERMVSNQVRNFIFSSTAAIFGEPEYVPINEAHNKKPINPYGHSKLMVEQMLESYDQAYGLKSICLRYFNAAGADPKSRIGERHDPETHLIPLVLQTASGRRESISIFGNDYDTDDGTCIRDYIHIVDLCNAHLLSAALLLQKNCSQQFNLGNGNGYSVNQLINVAKEITAKPIKTIQADRREGDPAKLVADATLAREVLGWEPKYSNLAEIVEHAWKWEVLQSK